MRSSNMTGDGPTKWVTCSRNRSRRMTARRAAERAAHEQVLPGESTDFSYADKDSRWHEERSAGSNRPETGCRGLKGEPTVVAPPPLLPGGPTYIGGYYTFPNVVL